MQYKSLVQFYQRQLLFFIALVIAELFFLKSNFSVGSLVAAEPLVLPQQQSLEITNWILNQTARGLTELTYQKTLDSKQSLHIQSDVQSTAWAESPSFTTAVPYSVTWWVWVSPSYYNGFKIYDGMDASGTATDIRIFFHDDRGDRSAKEGWHGFVWVDDAYGHYSITSVERGKWVKFSIQRLTDAHINLYINDKFVRTFFSRSKSAVSKIGKLGDTWAQWHRGEAYWSSMTVSSESGAASTGGTVPTDLTITSSDITFQPSGSVYDGQDVKISAVIHNEGSNSENVEVVINISETGKGLFDNYVTVPGSGTKQVEAYWTATPPGNYTIFITVNPFQKTTETNYTNNSASKVLTVTSGGTPSSTSGIEHTSADISFNPTVPSSGDNVTIKATVRNRSYSEKQVNVFFWYLRPGATSRQSIGFTQLMRVPEQGKIEPVVNWIAPNVEQVEVQTEVKSGGNVIAQASKTMAIGLPDLGISQTDIIFHPDTPYAFEITPINVEATVHNYGSKQESIWAVFTLDGSKQINRKLVTIPAGGTSITSDTVENLSVGRHTIQIELTSIYLGATALRESNYNNNNASRHITIKSAPDPAVVRLSVNPTKPNEGQKINIECEVANAGGTRTTFDLAIAVKKVDGSETTIGTYQIGPIVPGPPVTHTVRTSWTVSPYENQIVARVDPNNTAIEKSEANNVASKDIVVSFDATNVIGSGGFAFNESGDYTYRQVNGIQVWTYAKADGLRGPMQKYSSVTAGDYKIIRIDGPEGATRNCDLSIEVWYAGTIDRLSSGVSPIGGEVGDYFARVLVGVRPNQTPVDFEDGFYVDRWESYVDLFAEAVLTIGKVVIGAAISSGVGGLWGDAAGAATQVGYTLLDEGIDVTSCDDEVRRTERIEFRNLPFKAGQEYQVYVALVSIAKAVAAGVGVGYSEVDFYNRKPKNCDSDGSKIRTRGLQVKKVELICQ